MEQIINSALSSADVVIELAGLPPLVISLAPGPPDEKPSALASALRPAVSLRIGGQVIARQAPYGEPSAGVPWGLVGAVAGVAGVIAIVWAIAR